MAKPLSSVGLTLPHHRKAVVTGGSSGLGLAMVRRFLEAGLEVVVVSRSTPDFSHARLSHIAVDLSDRVALEEFCRSIEGLGVDLWVNNAGSASIEPWQEVGLEEEEKWLRLLVTAPLAMARAFGRSFSARKGEEVEGCLVQVSSLAVELPIPYFSTYNLAKAALSQHCASLALENDLPFRVLDFRPGDFNTPFIRHANVRKETLPKGYPERLELHHREAPGPDKAALTLVHALQRRKSGIVRTGTWGQRVLYPLGQRLLPSRCLFRMIRRYYGLGRPR
ncbi:MAG: SDR family oxidoreductase [Opitutales bacterium]|nr:SDR family oxidoreductase [Opitutales bacterium]MCH8539406.1 SDR family oxidoreductase [Opitutales bacterium]